MKHHSLKRGLFITLEGTDGVGKSTQAKLLFHWLTQRRRKSILTREPGGGPFAEKIRGLLLDPKNKIHDLTELFLYQAARVEHLQHVILPALQKGIIVICDRFTDATMAYQGYGRGLPLPLVQSLNKMATRSIKPDLTVLLDYPPKKALQKAMHSKNGKKDRLENGGIQFLTRVYHGYQAQHRKEPSRIKRVLVQPTIEETQALIQSILVKKFGL